MTNPRILGQELPPRDPMNLLFCEPWRTNRLAVGPVRLAVPRHMSAFLIPKGLAFRQDVSWTVIAAGPGGD